MVLELLIQLQDILDIDEITFNDCLKFDDINVNLDYAIKDLIDLFKRLIVEQNELSLSLSENQKTAIIQNKLEYHFNEILEANVFRFAKISNREDDIIYKLIKEGVNIG